MNRVLATALVALLYIGFLGGMGATASAEVLADDSAATRDTVSESADDAPEFRNYLRRCRRLMSDDTPAVDSIETCRQLWQRWCASHPDSRICHRPSPPPPDCRVSDHVIQDDEISDAFWKRCGDTFNRWCTAHPEKCREIVRRWCESHTDTRWCTTHDRPRDCRITDRVTDRAPDRLCPAPVEQPIDIPTDRPSDMTPHPHRCAVVKGTTVCRLPIDPPDCEATDRTTDRLCRAPIDTSRDELVREAVTDGPVKELPSEEKRPDDAQVRVLRADL